MATAVKARRKSLFGWLADDGAVLRVAFFAMLAGTVGVLYIDWRELSQASGDASMLPDIPLLPGLLPGLAPSSRGPAVTTDPALLEQPLVVELGVGGVLQLTGTIDQGSAERVATELAARGEYVTRVALNSPGGVVEEAMGIGRLLLAQGLRTSVAAGAICASSCPLILAGGKEREASRAAAIGVHQVYALARADQVPTGAQGAGRAMSEAQRTTAAITRYLQETGVDPAIWVHALETPPEQLYFLTPEELERYRLATVLVD